MKRMNLYLHDVALLDAALQPYLQDGFFFVNVGANDGVTSDPIYPFIQKYGWTGIEVEPVPYVFEQLVGNLGDRPGILFENAAIASEAGERSFYFMQEGSGSLPYVMQQIGALSKDRVHEALGKVRLVGDKASRTPPTVDDSPVDGRSHAGPIVGDDAEDFVTEVAVRCVRFNDLMQKHDVRRIDFLNIDAEGSDVEIFLSIDLDGSAPRVLCIESLGGQADDQVDELRRALDARGYQKLCTFGFFSEVFALD